MTILALIRHGVTDWNREGRAQGQTDIPLNAEGVAQAIAVAARMAESSWDAVYASDLSRAMATAETIGEAVGLPVRTDSRLREMSCGVLEGTTVEERPGRWGEDWQTREAELGVEAPASLMDRGSGVLEAIAARHPGGRVIVVSHGALLGWSLKRLIPHADTVEHLANTSVTVVERTGRGWECLLYNCTRHLPTA